MTTKKPKLDADLQKDLLDRPLKCLEGVSLDGLTMNDGIELMQRIFDEINGYLEESPIAKNLARQIANHQRKSATLGIFMDLEIGVTSESIENVKRQPKKRRSKTEPIDPFLFKEEPIDPFDDF